MIVEPCGGKLCHLLQRPRLLEQMIRQLADGGRIVAPVDAGDAGPLLVLDKTAPDEVTGHIDPYPAWFMPLREHAGSPLGPGQSTSFTATGMAHYGTTTTNPATLLAGDADLTLFFWLHLPGLWLAGGQPCGSVIAHTADALAEAQLTPGQNGTWEVVQRGQRRLWDTIEHAVTAFEALGRPDRSRYGVTALDDPYGCTAFPCLRRERSDQTCRDARTARWVRWDCLVSDTLVSGVNATPYRA